MKDIKDDAKRMKVLVTDTAPLYPPLWGGPRRIYDLYSNFKQSDVSYVGLNIEPGFKASKKIITLGMKEVIVPPDKKAHSIKKAQLNLMKGLTFDLYSYLLMRWDKCFVKAIRKESKGKDVLIASHVWSFPCLRRKGKQLLVYDSHNVEYDLMRQITKGRAVGRLISYLVKGIEKRACRKSDLIFACSHDDKKRLAYLYNVEPKKIIVVPNTTDTARFNPASIEEKEACKRYLGLQGNKTVLFVGAYYNPNIEALRFIVKEIAPKLKDCTFLVAGSVKNSIGEFIDEKIIGDNIMLLGAVSNEELVRIMKASDIAINPMFRGSGIQIKMLDYMAAGLPIVTTEVGARGLGIVGGEHALICGSSEMESSIRKLLSDEKRMNEMRINALGKAVQFDSEHQARILEQLINDRKTEMIAERSKVAGKGGRIR